jgi:molybdopterin-guanine dinucleotide biosynthesis protein A
LNSPHGHAVGDVDGFVLAGGQSSRMGSDKAFIRLNGRPLVVHALDTLRRAGLPVTIAGARCDLSVYAPVLDDAGFGPLDGICAALAASSAEYAAFLPVDMPLLPSSLISVLVEYARSTHSAVTVPSVNGFTQTFPCVLQRAALPALESEFKVGNDGCFSAFWAAAAHLQKPFTVLAVENLVQAGQFEVPHNLSAAFWFLNVNTPADLDRTQSLVAAHQVI